MGTFFFRLITSDQTWRYNYRRLFSTLAVVVLTLPLAYSQSDLEPVPDIAKIGENGLLRAELIYSLDGRPTPECHASTIAELDDGFLAAWFGGTHEKHADVGIWISRMMDGVWSRPEEIANGVINDNLRYPCWNPVLFRPADGRLMLFYKVGPSPSEWWGMLTVSSDEGKTWSDPSKMGMSKHGHLLGPIKNKPVQLANGTIISPTSMEFDEEDEVLWKVYFEVSKDLGKTWGVSEFLNDGMEFDAIQPSILIHPDNVLQILCRSRQGVITQSWSRDGGITWSQMTATDLPNPNSGTDAITLMDGRHLLVYNHTIRDGDFPDGRDMLNVALSEDGEHWKPVLTLERQEGEYSYPSVIQSSDALVHITYTYQRKSVKYAVLDLDRLKIKN